MPGAGLGPPLGDWYPAREGLMVKGVGEYVGVCADEALEDVVECRLLLPSLTPLPSLLPLPLQLPPLPLPLPLPMSAGSLRGDGLVGEPKVTEDMMDERRGALPS